MQILDDDLRNTPIFAALLAERGSVRRMLTSRIPVPTAPTRKLAKSADRVVVAEVTSEPDIIRVMPLPHRKPGASLPHDEEAMPSWLNVSTVTT